jgi:hypothetical protein
MLKTRIEKPNVEVEETIQKDLWRHLSLKSPDIPKPDRYPLSSRLNKENMRVDSSSKFFSSKSPAESRDVRSSLKHETDSYETLKVKSQLHMKIEQVKAKERQLMKLEHELNQKIINFEEEKEKWCVHISLKLKDIENKEEQLEVQREKIFFDMEKIRIKEKCLKRTAEEIKKNKAFLDEFEKREEKLRQNEEIFEMKVEDLAGYERKIVLFEEGLRNKEEELEKVAEIIENRKNDIAKTAEMFEKIHEHLKLEEHFIQLQRVSQSKVFSHDKSLLNHLNKSSLQNKITQDHSLASLYPQPSEISICESISFSSDQSEALLNYNIRTPE